MILGRRNKFGARKTRYNGTIYASKREALYARDLDLLVKGKKLKRWEAQIAIPMVINGKKVCTYNIDFVEYDMDDKPTFVEVKGFETAVFKLKWRLFDALYPDWQKRIVK